MSEPLLELRGLSKWYGSRAALAGLDLTVEPGQIWAVVGENGAGKSTLLRLLAGLQGPSGGSVLWRGRPERPLAASFRARIGYCPERPALFERWTVRENLSFFAGLRGVAAAAPPPSLGIAEFLDRRVEGLSRGQLHRATLAVAMLGEPELLLLDEPHAGLDLPSLERTEELLRSFGRRGAAILLTTHLLASVTACCTHLLVLSEGRALAAGPLQLLLREPAERGLSLARVYRSLEGCPA
ncbi:MAG: ABC transporter ATP-binding protein [Myxococcales bacterium]